MENEPLRSKEEALKALENLNKSNFLFGPSGKGRSLIGEAMELLNKEGFLLVSSLQRHLKIDSNTAESLIATLKKMNLIEKSTKDYSYVLKIH